ncbi:MAG: hypothetical protein IT536_13860 [Hyphomicrobiales bacterium]|nr:hypothetical protein [Hyphomicrobiales bacterium]
MPDLSKRRQPRRRRPIGFATLPPPVGGWNVRDAIPLMDPKDAIRLDNLIPDTNSVHLRSGYAVHATIAATATAVETLIPYSPANTANARLYAAIATAIYDVTAAATASASAIAASALTSARWQYAQMTNPSGTYLLLANGADAPRLFDGTNWTTASVTATGLTTTDIVAVHNHMNRLWLIEENQLHVWYLGTSAIAGSPTKFLLPFRNGGKLMAMGTWSRDGGAGLDDLAVFVSSRGECIVDSGADPSTVNAWTMVGLFKIPEVIGRRCLINAGADLGILTAQGLVPLSGVLGMTAAAAARVAFTDKISGAFRDRYRASGTAFGWQCVEYPKQNLLIVNVPIAERATQHQYVMNVNTGAWCRFTNINVGCWALLGDALYCGGNGGIVYRFDVSHLDAGTANITGTLQSAYSTFGSPHAKRFTMARPLFLAPAGYNPPVTVQTDYDTSEPAVNVVAAAAGGTPWDAAQWDSFQWAGGAVPSLGWQGVTGIGRAASVAFGISAREELTYNGIDVGFEAGGDL